MLQMALQPAPWAVATDTARPVSGPPEELEAGLGHLVLQKELVRTPSSSCHKPKCKKAVLRLQQGILTVR